jgi:hypothetical protein
LRLFLFIIVVLALFVFVRLVYLRLKWKNESPRQPVIVEMPKTEVLATESSSAEEYARAPWRNDDNDARSPRNCTFRELRVTPDGAGLRLINASGREVQFSYEGVSAHSSTAAPKGHCLQDELRHTPDGSWEHRVRFETGEVRITARDLTYGTLET